MFNGAMKDRDWIVVAGARQHNLKVVEDVRMVAIIPKRSAPVSAYAPTESRSMRPDTSILAQPSRISTALRTSSGVIGRIERSSLERSSRTLVA